MNWNCSVAAAAAAAAVAAGTERFPSCPLAEKSAHLNDRSSCYRRAVFLCKHLSILLQRLRKLRMAQRLVKNVTEIFTAKMLEIKRE